MIHVPAAIAVVRAVGTLTDVHQTARTHPAFLLCRDGGKISKTLTLQPLGEKGDWFLGLDVKDATNRENSVKLGLPITGAELHTMKTLSEVELRLCPHSLAMPSTSLGVCHAARMTSIICTLFPSSPLHA